VSSTGTGGGDDGSDDSKKDPTERLMSSYRGRTISSTLVLMLSVSYLLPLCGCAAAVGYGVGSKLDRNRAVHLENPQSDEIVPLKGQRARIELEPGGRFSGTIADVVCEEGKIVIGPSSSFPALTYDTLAVERIRVIETNGGSSRAPLTLLGLGIDVVAVIVIARSLGPISLQ
jgi:hypothetical protein